MAVSLSPIFWSPLGAFRMSRVSHAALIVFIIQEALSSNGLCMRLLSLGFPLRRCDLNAICKPETCVALPYWTF